MAAMSMPHPHKVRRPSDSMSPSGSAFNTRTHMGATLTANFWNRTNAFNKRTYTRCDLIQSALTMVSIFQ